MLIIKYKNMFTKSRTRIFFTIICAFLILALNFIPSYQPKALAAPGYCGAISFNMTPSGWTDRTFFLNWIVNYPTTYEYTPSGGRISYTVNLSYYLGATLYSTSVDSNYDSKSQVPDHGSFQVTGGITQDTTYTLSAS